MTSDKLLSWFLVSLTFICVVSGLPALLLGPTAMFALYLRIIKNAYPLQESH